MKHVQNIPYKTYIKLYIWKIYTFFIQYNSICNYMYNSSSIQMIYMEHLLLYVAYKTLHTKHILNIQIINIC